MLGEPLTVDCQPPSGSWLRQPRATGYLKRHPDRSRHRRWSPSTGPEAFAPQAYVPSRVGTRRRKVTGKQRHPLRDMW